MKINKDDVIEIHGFVMLKGFNDGDMYRCISLSGDGRIYYFKKINKNNKLSKKSIGFYKNQIDGWIGNNLDNNHISIKGD